MQTKCDVTVYYSCCVRTGLDSYSSVHKGKNIIQEVDILSLTFKTTFGFICRFTSGLISALYIQPHLDFFLQPYIWPHNQLIFGLTLDFFLQPYIWPHNKLTFGFISNFTFGLTFGQTFSLTFGYTFSLNIFIQLHDFIIQLLDSIPVQIYYYTTLL